MVLVVTVLTGALTMWTGAHRLAIPALLATVVLGLVIIAKQSTSPGLILGYAAVEGVLLGAVSLVFESLYPGIVRRPSSQRSGSSSACWSSTRPARSG